MDTYRMTGMPEDTCVQCMSNSVRVSAYGFAKSDCLCSLGYEVFGGSCTACPAGKYKDFLGLDACVQCPVSTGEDDRQASMTSPVGSTSADSCVCPEGYTEHNGFCYVTRNAQINSIAGCAPANLMPDFYDYPFWSVSYNTVDGCRYSNTYTNVLKSLETGERTCVPGHFPANFNLSASPPPPPPPTYGTS